MSNREELVATMMRGFTQIAELKRESKTNAAEANAA